MSKPLFHLIGIGGAGMSVVAQLLVKGNAQVSGSDMNPSPTLDYLNDLGITTFVGHDISQVPPNAVVVVSSAIRDSNVELAGALARGQRVIHRSQALAMAGAGHRFIAVAGAHGKTTTSAMLAHALLEVGLDPSFAVGGVIGEYGSGARVGKGHIFVAEADESDGSFLNYQPDLELITNIEPDHLDHYRTRENFDKAFVDFAARLRSGGVVVICSDDPGGRRLAQVLVGKCRVVTYGFQPGVQGVAGHTLIKTLINHNGQAALTYTPNSQYEMSEDQEDPGLQVHSISTPLTAHIRMLLPGLHNILNAAGAWSAGVELGIDPVAFARALSTFSGTKRRMELIGTKNNIRVYDDYAHHPTEVSAAIEAGKQLAQNGRVLVVFQPHLYSRTRNFASLFAKALHAGDQVVVCSVYGAREDPIDGVEGSIITDLMAARPVRFIPDRFEAGAYLASLARPGDVIITMGAGDITQVGPAIVDALGE